MSAASGGAVVSRSRPYKHVMSLPTNNWSPITDWNQSNDEMNTSTRRQKPPKMTKNIFGTMSLLQSWRGRGLWGVLQLGLSCQPSWFDTQCLQVFVVSVWTGSRPETHAVVLWQFRHIITRLLTQNINMYRCSVTIDYCNCPAGHEAAEISTHANCSVKVMHHYRKSISILTPHTGIILNKLNVVWLPPAGGAGPPHVRYA